MVHMHDARVATRLAAATGSGPRPGCAAALTISIKTVKTQVGNLLAKLNARDRARLVIIAYDVGLVTPD